MTYRFPESERDDCGMSSVRSMGPPFQVELPVILTLAPCFAVVAVITKRNYSTEGEGRCIHLVRTGRILELRSQCNPGGYLFTLHAVQESSPGD